MKLPAALHAYLRDARDAFAHAPLEVLTGLLVAAAFSAALRSDHPEWFFELAVAAGLAFTLFFGISVLHARGVVGSGARWGASAAVAAAALAYGVWGVDAERSTDVWRAACLLGAAVLALTLAPLPRGPEPGGPAEAAPPPRAPELDPAAPDAAALEAPHRERFWRFNARLLARTVSVGLYGAALWAALAGAVAAVVTLFELRSPGRLYGDLAGAVFFGLVPWVLVGGLPGLLAEPADRRAPPVVGTLGRYLFLPVLVVYVAILTAYTVKVAATGELPKNLLSPIVLLAGLFGFLGALFVEPLLRDRAHTAVARTVRVFPAVLLFLLPLATWAVWERRGQYGWTEFRVLRLLLLLGLAVLAVWGTARLVRRRAPLLAEIPAVLGAALLAGALVAGPVSRADQTARLRAALAEAGLLRGGRYAGTLLPPAAPMADTTSVAAPAAPPERADAGPSLPVVQRALYDRIQGTLSYLYEAHGARALRPVFGPRVERYASGWDVLRALPVTPGCDVDTRGALAFANLPERAGIPGVAGGTLYRMDRWGRDTVAGDEALPVRLVLDGTTVEVVSRAPDAWRARVDLAPLVARLSRPSSECRWDEQVRLAPAEALRPLVDASGRVRGQILFGQVGVGPAPGSPPGPGRVLEVVSAIVVVAPPAPR